MRQLQGHLAGSERRQYTTEDHRSRPQRVLRVRGDPAGGAEGFPTEPFYHRYDVCDSFATEVGAEETNPLCVCFIDLTKAYESVDRTLLWTILTRFGVPHNMISAIRQVDDGMRACVRLGDRVCSGWFAVEYGLRQGCVLAPLLFNIFFAAVINGAYTRFKADKDIMNALVYLRKKMGEGGRGKATAREPVLATPLWGMLYPDDVGGVSQSPEQLRKMVGLIMVVCTAFGLTVSEAKTEIMCLSTKGMPESTALFSVEAADQLYNQTNEFVCLGGNVNHNADLSNEVDRRIRNAWCSFRKYTIELYDRPSAPLELKIRMLRAEVLEIMMYGCVTWSPRSCHYDTLRLAHHSFLACCIGWRKNTRADHPISYLETFIKMGSESIEATLRRRRIFFAGFVARVEDTSLTKGVMFVELVGGAGCVGGAGKRVDGWGVSWTTSELSASTPTSGRLQPRTRGNGAERQNKGRNISWQNESSQKKTRLDYGMQWYART